MKKILILAYDFPPFPSVGGQRPYAWLQHFKEFGLEPTVVTKHYDITGNIKMDYVSKSPNNKSKTIISSTGKVICASYKPSFSNKLFLRYGEKRFLFLRKSLSFFLEIKQFFLPVGTKRCLYNAAKNEMKLENYDVILATGDPFVLFHYAKKLSVKFQIPWIADYRDPWNDPVFIKNKQLRHLISFIEKRTLKDVSFITTVNLYFKEILHKDQPQKNIHIIENGYEETHKTKNNLTIQKNNELRITLTGNIYLWQPFLIFVDTFVEFIKTTNADAKLIFYGINLKNEITSHIQKFHPENKYNFEFHERISNKELHEKVKNDHLLLLFNYFEITGTKIYDYLLLGKKILFCFDNYPDNQSTLPGLNKQKYTPQKEIIEKTNSGIIVKDPSHLKAFLVEIWEEFEKSGQIKNQTKNIEEYSRRIQTKKLAEIILSKLS